MTSLLPIQTHASALVAARRCSKATSQSFSTLSMHPNDFCTLSHVIRPSRLGMRLFDGPLQRKSGHLSSLIHKLKLPNAGSRRTFGSTSKKGPPSSIFSGARPSVDSQLLRFSYQSLSLPHSFTSFSHAYPSGTHPWIIIYAHLFLCLPFIL